MKKLIICITLLTCYNLVGAQQKYFPFNINGKHGITDVSGNEVVKPIYRNSEIIEAKSQIYLKGLEDQQHVIIDAKTGNKQFFEYIFREQVKIKDVPYSMILNKGKRFLLSEESDKTINLTEEYWDFKNVDNYIIATYYPKRVPSKSTSYDKKGIPLPPKIEKMPAKTSTILANDETLKRLIKSNFDSYILMYKQPETEKEDRLVKVQLIQIKDYNKPVPFDFILLSKGNTHNLYDGKLGLTKTFVLAKATQEQLLNGSKKIVDQNLAFYSDNSPAPTMIVAAPSMPRTNAQEPKKEDKKPFKPFFYTEELANGNMLFALQETEEISKHILEAKSGLRLYLNKTEHTLTITPKDKESSRFSFNPETGVIYLPKIYLKQLGLTII
ncbi:hypothetical protein GJU39_10680 [Pedobacter petrophilus]|uniref:Uncharacterized protein n=1 Tax=Pedobacter petrophilus TaxID=1908241 RepID=A0A7K0FY79_9SPHI|nr:hypothetical protein [Pedobacter petrophilus]MRX76557.1 hypothetical protein [Pedobacter petrophilus]